MYGPLFIQIVAILMFSGLILAICGMAHDSLVKAEKEGNWLLKYHLAAIVISILLGIYLVCHPAVIGHWYAVFLPQ